MGAHTLYGHQGPVYSAAVAKDSKFLLSGGMDGIVRLWSVTHSTCLVAYRGHGHPVFHVAFSPHNSHFLTGCYDGAMRIYTTERRAPLRVLAGHLAGSLTANGQEIKERKSFRKVAVFVTQDDLMLETQTPREVISFSARTTSVLLIALFIWSSSMMFLILPIFVSAEATTWTKCASCTYALIWFTASRFPSC